MESAAPSTDFKRIHDEMIVIDGTAPLLSWGLDLSGQAEDDSGKGFDPYVEGGVTAAAAGVSTARVSLDQVRNAVAFHNKVIEERGFSKIRSAKDVKRAKRETKFGVWYHMQSSVCLEEDIDVIEELKEAGVGLLQPAYNYRNRFANGQLERVDCGLSKSGIDLVQKCNELQVILDGSHNGARDTLDMIEFSSSPVVISHANAKAVYDHPRNVSDDVITAVAENGGFVGVNGWPVFVSDSQRPTFDQFFAHLDHIVELVGPDHTTIGMDYFQMIEGLVPADEVQKGYDQFIASGAWTVVEYGKPPYVFPAGIETPATLFNITGGLLERGYRVDDVQKIMGGNWLRIMEEVWGA